jgi:hypothetical protein
MIELPHARPAAVPAAAVSNGAEHLPVVDVEAEPALPEPTATAVAEASTDAHEQALVPTEPAVREPRRPRPRAVDPAENGNGNGELHAQPRAVKQSTKRTPRGRRFVLPPLDEDQARSVRAIEAFLDGPPPPADATAPERPARRRHRVRRTAGTPVPRTTMVVWLQGYSELDRAVGSTRAATVANAFVDSLRRAARATDEVREMGSGRCRIVVDTDDAGATAFVERARRGVQPWLELLAVPLKVEAGARESSEIVPFSGSRRAAGDH